MSTSEEVRNEFLKEVEERGLTPQRELALQRARDLATIRRVASSIDERNLRALRSVSEAAKKTSAGLYALAEKFKEAGENNDD